MPPPDSASAALGAPGAPGAGALRANIGWWLLAVVATAATARLTMVSPQMGCTAALMVLTVGLYLWKRSAGLAAAWITWLVAPFIRRVLFLSDPLEGSDPLALAPFLVTAAIVGLELLGVDLSERAKRILWLVAAGYAIGIPVGLFTSPPSAAFALFAYLTAAGCFVIGYREGREGARLVLPTTLMLVVPLMALYAFPQYYGPLPEWDQVWFDTAEIATAGSDDGDRVRVWSTLNSPGTFAAVAALAAIAFVSLGRLRPLYVIGALSVLAALALSYVRSAWAGLAVAILGILVVSRGKALKQVAPVALVMVVLAPVVFTGGAGAELGDRVSSFGSLEQDTSAQARLATPLALVPDAVARSLGKGIGQAGEATRLNESAGFRYTDNGYLALMFQVGPLGFLLVMAAIVAVLRAAWHTARGSSDSRDVFVAGTLVFFVTTLFAGDQLYGVTGMIFWYIGGLAVRRGEEAA